MKRRGESVENKQAAIDERKRLLDEERMETLRRQRELESLRSAKQQEEEKVKDKRRIVELEDEVTRNET